MRDEDLAFSTKTGEVLHTEPRTDRSMSVTEQLQEAKERERLLEIENKQLREQKAKNANRDFVQVSRAEMRKISELSSKESGQVALNILMIFAQSMNKQNAVIISTEMLQRLTGKSRATVSKSIKLLKTDQWIQVIRIGNMNAYVLNSAVFWTSTPTGKHAAFNATVMTTFEEQDTDLRKNPSVKLHPVPVMFQEPDLIQNGVELGSDQLDPPDQQDI